MTDGTHVTAGQLALALTPYAQVTDLAVNTAASGNNAAAIQSLDDRVTAELASKLDSSALAPAIAPLATTDGQVAAHGQYACSRSVFTPEQATLSGMDQPVQGHIFRHKPLLPGRFCAVQRGPQPASRGRLPHSRRGHGRGCALRGGTKGGTRFVEDDLVEDPEAGALASNGQGPPSITDRLHCTADGAQAAADLIGAGAAGLAAAQAFCPGRGGVRAPERAAPSGPGAAASTDHRPAQ